MTTQTQAAFIALSNIESSFSIDDWGRMRESSDAVLRFHLLNVCLWWCSSKNNKRSLIFHAMNERIFHLVELFSAASWINLYRRRLAVIHQNFLIYFQDWPNFTVVTTLRAINFLTHWLLIFSCASQVEYSTLKFPWTWKKSVSLKHYKHIVHK